MNRERWNGWVTLAWLIVALAIVVGLFLVSTLGTIDVPSQDLRGNITWQEEPNPAVWGLAIGQIVAAAMLAAMFSMLNSIYKNSCDLLVSSSNQQGNTISSGTIKSSEKTVETEVTEKLSPLESKASMGLVVQSIERKSPLYHLLKPGYAICKVNGQEVISKEKMFMGLVQGKNLINFADTEDRKFEVRLKLNPDDLGIVFINDDIV